MKLILMDEGAKDNRMLHDSVYLPIKFMQPLQLAQILKVQLGLRILRISD